MEGQLGLKDVPDDELLHGLSDLTASWSDSRL
jgi:hypothetical protein